MLMREIWVILISAVLLDFASARCETCKACLLNPEDCIPCHNGACLHGCVPGYHGRMCSESCPPGCVTCRDDATCLQCSTGRYGLVCQHECPNCSGGGKCLQDTGACHWGCDPGYDGSPCRRSVSGDAAAADDTVENPAKERKGLSEIFQDQDYLLPVIGCVLVVCGAISVLIICKHRRNKLKNSQEDYGKEEGKCNEVSSQSNFQKKSKLELPDNGFDSLDSLKKRLSDSDLPQLLTVPGEKLPLALLRNRAGNCSVPFMDPIVEDQEEDEEEEEEPQFPNPRVIFHLEPHSDESEEIIPLMSNSESTPDGPNNNSFVPYNVDDDIYILQNGPNEYGHAAQNTDYMDNEASGHSTSMVPDMYAEHVHDATITFPTKLSHHLNTYLTARPTSQVSSNQNGKRISID